MTLQHLKKLCDSLPDGVSIIDSDMRIDWVNKVHHENGFHRDGVKGKKCYFIYKGRDRICRKCPALKALLTKKTIRIEERGADGKHYEVTAVPLHGKEEKVMEIVREIKKRKPFVVSLASAQGIMAFVVDAKGKFVAMNSDAEKATGFTEKEMAGTSFTRLIKKENVAGFRKSFRSIIRGKLFPSFETEFRTKTGEAVPMEINCSPFHSEGVLLGVEIIARGITQRRNAEKTLKTALKKKKAARKKTSKKRKKAKK